MPHGGVRLKNVACERNCLIRQPLLSLACVIALARPIETILTLPRVRLFNKVPILETERLVQRFLGRAEYRQRLLKDAFRVSAGSARQFSFDDRGLAALLEAIASDQYVVTARSRSSLEAMLRGICGDGVLFKDFKLEMRPLCDVSPSLRGVSKLAGSLADRAKEEAIDVARALFIKLPV